MLVDNSLGIGRVLAYIMFVLIILVLLEKHIMIDALQTSPSKIEIPETITRMDP